MEVQYFKQWSEKLGREMETKVYGHGGKPMLFIPCQDGRFFDFENFKMTDTWAPWIDAGKVTVFTVDTIDKETWSNKDGDPAWRSARHEQWMSYIFDELVPFIRKTVNKQNGKRGGKPKVIAFGCSLGATHALNLFLRRPDLFGGLLALSGIYDAAYGFDGYMDEGVYLNSPVHFLPNLPENHPTIQEINKGRGIICVGLGAWEQPETTRRVDELCRQKGIHMWVDYWGYDVNHDWPWWHKQAAYFAPHLLDEA